MLAVSSSQGSQQGCGSTIKEGDLVIVYEGYDRIKSVRVQSNGQMENSFGSFKHKEWIGLPFGSRVWASRGNGYVHLLAATPELWTQVLSHRTQILYVADISLVVSMLELRPGSIVLESGTGSGSLTTSLARAVAPTGHVHTFEFHEQRANMAREEFEKNGIANLVTVTQRDIQGLGFPSSLEGQADGVFLDLPGPWNVVPSAACCLRPDGPFCSFSPCIEQVQRTCETLAKNGFTDIRTFEILLRSYEVRREHLMTALRPAGMGKGEEAPTHPEAADDARTNAADSTQQPEATTTMASPTHKRLCTAAHRTVGGDPGTAEQQDASTSSKPAADGVSGEEATPSQDEEGRGRGAAKCDNRRGRGPTRPPSQGGDTGGLILAKPVAETKGHTGYLTFARLAS